MDHQTLMLSVVAASSLGAYVLGARRLGLQPGRLPAALGAALETLGVAVAFFGVNLVAGLAVILAFRSLGGRFVPIYLTNDVTWIGLALLQGLVFQAWRASR
jgi:hypothetical protein